jgi:hypothetical protein
MIEETHRFTWKIGEQNGPWLNVCIIEEGEKINKIWIYNTETHQEKVGWTTNLNSFLNKEFKNSTILEKNESNNDDKNPSKATLALELMNPNEKGVSRWVDKSEFNGKYSILDFNNGNSWYRDTLLRKYVFERKGAGKNYKFRLNGFKEDHDKSITRLIRPDIREQILSQNCAHTGFRDSTNNHIVVDHKNGRYNDKDVLTLESQHISDFQPLSNQANLQKRSDCTKCKQTGIRFDAKELGYSVSYYRGSEIYDESSPCGCVGCYWYDPKEFKRCTSLINQ